MDNGLILLLSNAIRWMYLNGKILRTVYQLDEQRESVPVFLVVRMPH